MKPGTIFSGILDWVKEEVLETLWRTDPLQSERIISSGQATPSGKWHEQQADEWVILRKGSAVL